MTKHLLPLVVAAALFGAGCNATPKVSSTPSTPMPWPRAGAALVRGAALLEGPTMTATDAQTGRRFSSILPATFTDGNGNYTTQVQGELVDVQVAVGGTPQSDSAQFAQLEGISSIEEQEVGPWHVTTAFDTKGNRWVARATQPDAYDGTRMYHVIECLSTAETAAAFWDGCRTIIEHAAVDQGITGSGSSPTP